MKKTNPLLLWIILWIAGVFIITFKNRLMAGTELELGRIVFLNLMLDIVVVPGAFIGYWLIKLIAKAVGAKDLFEGQTGLRNTIITWLVLFLIVFLFPIFRQ